MHVINVYLIFTVIIKLFLDLDSFTKSESENKVNIYFMKTS